MWLNGRPTEQEKTAQDRRALRQRLHTHILWATEPWRFHLYADEGKETFVQAYIDSQPTVEGQITKRVQNKAQYYREIPIHLSVIMPKDPRQRRWDGDYGAAS